MKCQEKVSKRCYSCHGRKPGSAFDKSETTADGLETACRSCNDLFISIVPLGGLSLWHQVRDALRAASPEGK